jgi:DNA-binding response OmpR family regulator
MVAEKQTTILVVDDNEMNRDVLSRRLERQGYRVVTAEDGVMALEAVQSEAFDLVLLDIMMPRMNGYEVLEALKRDPAHKAIPVIVISAMDDLESVVRCIELGADDYLFKPFNPVLLRARINASLSRRSLELTPDQIASIHNLTAAVRELASGSRGALTPSQQEILAQMARWLSHLDPNQRDDDHER